MPRPSKPVPTSDAIRRSGRSTRPPSAVSPAPSARALTYEMTCPATRQTSAATPSASCPLARHHQAIAANRTPSAMRSQTESSTAPNGVLNPRARAIAPSIMSNSTKTVTSSAPRNSWPRGMNTTAAAAVPTVPATVTASGETPRATSQRPTGPVIRPRGDARRG